MKIGRRRPAEPDPEVIERVDDVIARVGLSRATIYRLMDLRKFPPALKIGERAIGWRRSTIDAWIAERTNPTEAARR